MSIITSLDLKAIEGSRVLFTDDDLQITTPIKQYLEQKGYKVEIAQDGEEGLKKALASPPNLVLLDVMMPAADGWTMLKKLRTNKDFSLIPILIMSALDSTEDQRRGYGLGADDYIKKPFAIPDLEKRIIRALVEVNKLKARIEKKLKEKEGQKDPALLKGSLKDFGLVSLISLCQQEQICGNLMVTNQKEECGLVYFNNGQASYAKIVKKPLLKNEEAIYHMLYWNEGEFEVHGAVNDNVPREISVNTDAILLEAVTRIDEGT